MSQGISSTPAITVPYRGIDEWVRTAILSGGTALLALAALLAFWPRRGTTPRLPDRRGGRPRHALRGPDHRARSRLALLRRRAVLHPARRLPVARARALRPGRRSPRPAWWPRRSSGRSSRRAWTAPGRGSTTRLRREARAHEGRGVLVDAQLRAADVVARRARAAAHQGHDARPTGRRPTSTSSTACAGARAPPSRDAADPAAPATAAGCRPSRSSTAGCARRSSSAPATCRTSCPGASRLALPQSDGTFVTSSKPLRPGDSYQALVYVPHPSDTQLKRAGTDYPGYTQDFLELRVPLRGASAGLVDQATGQAAGLQRRHPLRALRHRRPGPASCGPAASASSRTATGSWPTRPTPSSTR